jgi:DNA-binding MarR family transcriptional regulator
VSEAPPLFTKLARASILLESLQQECLEPLGLTFVEYTVLRVLDPGPLSPSKLADEVLRTTGGMTKLLDRLERRGLVRRTPHVNDRRGVLVELTGEGHELSGKASDAYSVGRNRLLQRLSAGERAEIEGGLTRLVEVLEKDLT